MNHDIIKRGNDFEVRYKAKRIGRFNPLNNYGIGTNGMFVKPYNKIFRWYTSNGNIYEYTLK